MQFVGGMNAFAWILYCFIVINSMNHNIHPVHSLAWISSSFQKTNVLNPLCIKRYPSLSYSSTTSIYLNRHCTSFHMSPSSHMDSTPFQQDEEDEEEDLPIRMTRTTETILNRSVSKKSTTSSSSSSNTIYSVPALYDLASSYRNYEQEVQFLLYAQQKWGPTPPSSSTGYRFLELAAGPARHSLTALKYYSSQITSCTAMDTSLEMLQYAQEIANEELHQDSSSSSFTYLLDDMRYMNTTTTTWNGILYDAVWLISGSMSHLLTLEDVIHCFQATHHVLHPGGLLVLELPHPKELFQMIDCTRNGWDIPLQDHQGKDCGVLNVVWGDAEDVFDPISQIRNMTLSMEWKGYEEEETASAKKRNKMTSRMKKTQGFGKRGQADDDEDDNVEKESQDQMKAKSVRDIVPMRSFTMQEIYALAKVGGFDVVDTFGALDEELDIHDEDAFRMVCVLRKKVM